MDILIILEFPADSIGSRIGTVLGSSSLLPLQCLPQEVHSVQAHNHQGRWLAEHILTGHSEQGSDLGVGGPAGGGAAGEGGGRPREAAGQAGGNGRTGQGPGRAGGGAAPARKGVPEADDQPIRSSVKTYKITFAPKNTRLLILF